MRKHYIDNIRWMAVLLLFPYHTARIFDAGQPFYVKGDILSLATHFVLACTPWFMPLLFVVAGISTKYALRKRSNGAYLKERVTKLLVPFLSGLILLVPVQTYYAERFHNGYSGTYLSQWGTFFTKWTDLSGYDGGFTPGQLWFVLYLFIISLLALLLINLGRKWIKTPVFRKISAGCIIPLFLVTTACSYVLDIGGKSMGEYFALFMLGYLFLSEDRMQEFLGRYRWPFLIVAVMLTGHTVIAQTFMQEGLTARLVMTGTSWISILAILGLSKQYLNFKNRGTDYFSASSFPLYIFHQSWIVLIGYYFLQLAVGNGLRYLLILAASFLLSVFTYELCRRWRGTRLLFGIKEKR